MFNISLYCRSLIYDSLLVVVYLYQSSSGEDENILINDEQFGFEMDTDDRFTDIQIRKDFPEVFLWDVVIDIGLVI